MLKKMFKKLFANSWVCPRCGTTNSIHTLFCTNCKNKRPD